jgi:hypothetical protein
MPLRRIALTGAAVLLGWLSQAGAYPPPNGEYAFWRELPEADRVARDMIGKDELDAAERRHAAVGLLIDPVTLSADSKGSRRAAVAFIGAILGLGLIAWGVRLKRSAQRRLTKLQKYEFANASPSGVIIFPNFEESRRHEKAMINAEFLLKCSRVPLVIGGLLVVLALSAFAL